jgi:hypothetical protein
MSGMLGSPRWRLALAGGLALAALLVTQAVLAQVNASVRLSPPNTDSFPTVSMYATVSEGGGRRLRGLPASAFDIFEDGVSRPALAVEEVELGARQLFVINTGPALAVRDSRGRTRFDFVRQSLLDWWQHPEASDFGADDLTLHTGAGPLVSHAPSAARLAATLYGFLPSFDPPITDYELLINALASLEGQSDGQQIPSVVVFFTPLVREPAELVVTNTIARANQLGATIFPVLIDTPEAVEHESYPLLVQLAEATGGSVYQLDPASPTLPDLWQVLTTLRTQYLVSYRSAVADDGPHQVELHVTQTGLIAASEPRSFEVMVTPPDVALVQPPQAITRDSPDPAVGVDELPPTETTIQAVVSFPDGHTRSLQSSQLLADDQAVQTRSSPPYDLFTWDLTTVDQSGPVTLEVVVVDELGLEGRSQPHVVAMTVVPPPGGLAALGPAIGSLLLVLGVLAAGIAIAVGLLTLGQRRQATPGPSRSRPRTTLARARLRPQDDGPIEAFLVPLLENGEPGEPLPLTGADVTLGRDASLAAFPLNDPTVSGLHARLIRQAGGDYLLRDQGSIAGTWVNFDPLPEDGWRLRHGDLVQLGRVTLRFQVPGAEASNQVQLEPLAGDLIDEVQEESPA